jgi:hypothetical protein
MPLGGARRNDVIVARNLLGPEAIKTALELDGSWSVHVWDKEFEGFRLYEWQPYAKKWPHDTRRLDSLYATVVKSTDSVRDLALGLSMIAQQFMRWSGHYSKASVLADEEFDERVRRIAYKREVRRLDKEIATKLIDALLAEGYVVTDFSSGEFKRSTDRDAILDYLFDIDRIELIVAKTGERFWMRLIFGENGWDLIQDYSVDLECIIDPMVKSYLPWKRASAADAGSEFLPPPSPTTP